MKETTKDILSAITWICLIGIMVFSSIYLLTEKIIFYILTVTSLTAFYHFQMRVIVIAVVEKVFENIDYSKKWFQENRIEKILYEIIDDKKINMTKRAIEEHIKSGCQAEISHEIIMILSYLPVIAGFIFGSWQALIVTSVIAMLADFIFVVFHRFNRSCYLKAMQEKR